MDHVAKGHFGISLETEGPDQEKERQEADRTREVIFFRKPFIVFMLADGVNVCHLEKYQIFSD